MKPYKKIALIILLTLVLLNICDMLFEKGFRKFYKPYFEKMDFVFKDTSYNDIIYIGNSRTHFGINPYYIDSICGTKSYNLGMGGADISEAYFFLDAYLMHHRAPKKIILTYDYNIFNTHENMALTPVFFYYTGYKIVREELQKLSYNATLLHIVPGLKYCFFNDYSRTLIIQGLRGKSISDQLRDKGRKSNYDYRGFVNYKTGKIIFKGTSHGPSDFIFKESKAFNDLISNCQQKNIQLVFIYPPEFHKPGMGRGVHTGKTSIDSVVISVCNRKHFYYKDFDLPEFTEEDFADEVHVNIKGSLKFSVLLGNYLKTIPQ